MILKKIYQSTRDRVTQGFRLLGEKQMILRDGFLGVATCYVLWTLINIFWFDLLVFNPICDMGTDRTKADYIREDSNLSFEDTIANFTDDQLLYILDRATGDNIDTRWQDYFVDLTIATTTPEGLEGNDESKNEHAVALAKEIVAASSGDHDQVSSGGGTYSVRRHALLTLAEQYGVLFDGPFVDPSDQSRRILHIYHNAKGSEQRKLTGQQLRRSSTRAPHHVSPVYPHIRITVTSKSGLMQHSSMRYVVEIWSSADRTKALSQSNEELLFERGGWTLFPFRPVVVHAEPLEAAANIVEDFESFTRIESVVGNISPGVSLEGAAANLDRKEREAQTRLISSVMETLISGDDTEPSFTSRSELGELSFRDRVDTLSQSLSGRLRNCRLVNGVNNAGIVNFSITVLVLFGVIHVLTAKREEMDEIEQQTDGLVAVLPMLGFAGTLYGMLLAFSSVGLGGSGAELISFIGISLDTTIIAVCGAILLSFVLLWKLRKMGDIQSP